MSKTTLDKILEQAYTDGASDTMWQNDRHVEIFATAKQRLLDWHNKQVEEVLDRLEATKRTADLCTDDTYVVKQKFIEAERNKLKG